MQNGISHRYQLEQSISVFREVRWYFIFIQILIEKYASKQYDPDQTPHFVASDLGLHYLPMSHKKDARRMWIKMQLFCLSHESCRNLGSILLK